MNEDDGTRLHLNCVPLAIDPKPNRGAMIGYARQLSGCKRRPCPPSGELCSVVVLFQRVPKFRAWRDVNTVGIGSALSLATSIAADSKRPCRTMGSPHGRQLSALPPQKG